MPMGNRNVSFLGTFRFFLVEGRRTGGSQASKQNEKKRHRNEMIGLAGCPNMSPMFSVPGHFRPHVLNAGSSGHDGIRTGMAADEKAPWPGGSRRGDFMGIKRVLVGLTAVVLVTSAVVACGFRGTGPWGGYGPCGPHWRGEDPAQRRAYVVERVSQELSLNVGQRAKLEVLADQLDEQRQALWSEGHMAADLQQVIAGERFDRVKAQSVVDQKLQAVQQHSPKVVDAMASFYDSLDAGQQRVVRERLKDRFGDRK
jgi:hypothetical protein